MILWPNVLLFFRSVVPLASLSCGLWLSCTQRDFQIRFPNGHLPWKQIPHPLWEFYNVIGSCHCINEIRALLFTSWGKLGCLFLLFITTVKESWKEALKGPGKNYQVNTHLLFNTQRRTSLLWRHYLLLDSSSYLQSHFNQCSEFS